MIAIEVRVNGKKVCVAGVAEGTINAGLFCAGGKDWEKDPETLLRFYLGGFDSKRNEHVDWNTPDFAVGDEIALRFVDADNVDEPQKSTPKGSGSAKEEFAREVAKQLGWKIQEK